MSWDRFFDDLEAQLASEWEAERAALDSEAERLRLSRVTLAERLAAMGTSAASRVSVEFDGGTVVAGAVVATGPDWLAIGPDGASHVLLAPLSAVTCLGLAHADLLASARPADPVPLRAARMGFGYVVRAIVRGRVAVLIGLRDGRSLAGTIDRAGADHLDLALHEAGTPRRAEAVTGHRLVPFAAIAWVRMDAAVLGRV